MLDCRRDPCQREERQRVYETAVQYPARFDLALRNVLDRMARDGIKPETGLVEAVATVAHMYRTIGDAAHGATRGL